MVVDKNFPPLFGRYVIPLINSLVFWTHLLINFLSERILRYGWENVMIQLCPSQIRFLVESFLFFVSITLTVPEQPRFSVKALLHLILFSASTADNYYISSWDDVSIKCHLLLSWYLFFSSDRLFLFLLSDNARSRNWKLKRLWLY